MRGLFGSKQRKKQQVVPGGREWAGAGAAGAAGEVEAVEAEKKGAKGKKGMKERMGGLFRRQVSESVAGRHQRVDSLESEDGGEGSIARSGVAGGVLGTFADDGAIGAIGATPMGNEKGPGGPEGGQGGQGAAGGQRGQTGQSAAGRVMGSSDERRVTNPLKLSADLSSGGGKEVGPSAAALAAVLRGGRPAASKGGNVAGIRSQTGVRRVKGVAEETGEGGVAVGSSGGGGMLARIGVAVTEQEGGFEEDTKDDAKETEEDVIEIGIEL
jgi:hypothetical protein